MKSVPVNLILVALATYLPALNFAYADALVVTKAASASTIVEIFVEKSKVRVTVEVGLADQEHLRDAISTIPTSNENVTAEKVARFFQQHFQIQSGPKSRLDCQVASATEGQRLARDVVTGEPLLQQPAEREKVILFELHFPLTTLPKRLIIQPPKRENSNFLVANIGFVAYHEGLPVNDFRYLAATATLNLDWDDPWYSKFQHPNLKRQYDSPMSVFLYVEPYEIRKEIVLRPADMQQWIDLGMEGRKTITVDQQAELKRKIADFLAKQGEVLVDGKPVAGKLDRINFIYRSLRTSGIIEPAVDLEANSATLGIIFVYPVDQLPDHVSLTWDLFSSKIQQIPGVASDEAGGLPSIITPETSKLEWKNFLKNPTIPQMLAVAVPPPKPTLSIPLISIACGLVAVFLAIKVLRSFHQSKQKSAVPPVMALALMAAAIMFWSNARVSISNPFAKPKLLAESECKTILASLLHNIYRSFDHHDESLIYDRLEQSIAGDLLAEVYLETRESVEIKNQGGLRISVKNVTVKELQQVNKDPLRPQFRCRWNVSGSIGHWGHIHQRANEHVALITIAELNDRWKVTAMELIDEKALDPTMPANPQASGQTTNTESGA